MYYPSRKVLVEALPILLLLSLPVRSTATSVVMLSDTELIVSSRFIVTGNIRSIKSVWDDAHAVAWTYVEVRTDRVLKGELEARTLVLKQIGGEAGGFGMRVFGQPKFARGQRVLLYLNTTPEGMLHVAHAFMGMLSIVEDKASGQQFVTRAIDAREVEVLSRGDSDAVTDRAALGSYIKKIQRTLRREASMIAHNDAQRAGDPVVIVPPEYSRRKKEPSGYTADFVLLGGGVRWTEPDLGLPVSLSLNPSQSPVAGGATAEVTRAMAAWPNQSGANIRLQIAGETGRCGLSFDGTSTISFGDCQNQLDPPVDCSGVVAQTSVVWSSETSVVNGRSFARLVETDVVFNKGINCFLGNSANLAEVACHELGHSIGLNHSADSTAIMWAVAGGRGRDATLANDDKAGALAIYPSTGGGGGGAPVSITTLELPDGVVNRAYRKTLSAAGGTPPYRWRLIGGALPPGLHLSSQGVIDGIPTRAGFFSIIGQVTDASGGSNATDSRQMSLTIGDDETLFPVITRVKIKKGKKLWVYGNSFSADSLIVLNGVTLTPKSLEQDATTETLFYKGRLSLRPDGANVLFVRTSDYWSAAYVF